MPVSPSKLGAPGFIPANASLRVLMQVCGMSWKPLLREPKAWGGVSFSSPGHLKQFQYLEKTKGLPKEIPSVDKLFHFLIFSKLKKKQQLPFPPLHISSHWKISREGRAGLFRTAEPPVIQGWTWNGSVVFRGWLTWSEISVNMSFEFPHLLSPGVGLGACDRERGKGKCWVK